MSNNTVSLSPYQNTVDLNSGAISGAVLAAGGSGQGLMVNNAVNAYSPVWSNLPGNPALTVSSTQSGQQSIHAKGDVVIDGQLTVGGQNITENITERLTAIEARLGILRPNERLEAKWETLRALREQYLAHEAELLEMEEVIHILKTHRP